MSKASSHQFSGTKGERIAQGKIPENQKKQVVAWAQDVISRMGENVSKRKREKFNTACVAFDESTGQLYFGRNGGIDRFGPDLHPAIKSILPPQSLTRVPTSWNCAETDAINNALHAGASLENLHIYTINTLPRYFGSDNASCENCTYMYKGRIKKNNTGWF
ncbi:MAG: YwqJ-related putative deaminase [Eubacteriales bacterium]|nr:YwqJ-related putative deaminase [Eubacteriales bacterium]